MDATRFDRLAISLGAATARRDALRFLAGLSFALLARGDANEAAAHNLLAKCKKIKDKKKRKRCLKQARAHNAQHVSQQPEPQACETAAACPDPPASQLCAVKACVGGQCGFAPKSAGTVCRPQGGPCDAAETCDGASLVCPPDAFRQAGGFACDGGGCSDGFRLRQATFCTGSSADCPPPSTIDCTPYRCAVGACLNGCQVDPDCASSHFCHGSACIDRQANGAACNRGRQCASGHCVGGVCCNSACVAPANATRTCASGTCAFACLEGFADCDGILGNGCETDITSHKQHCGGCGAVCAGPCAPGLIRLCEDGVCGCS